MNVLILSLGATVDVVRNTPLLGRLYDQITWLTAAKNTVLLENLTDNLRCFSWEKRQLVPDIRYDLIINLEDTLEVGLYLKTLQTTQLLELMLIRKTTSAIPTILDAGLISVLSALTAESRQISLS